MNTKLFSYVKFFVATLFATLLLTTSAFPVLAWWGIWYSPSFVASYSPSRYRHGQWESTSLESFGSQMKWNTARAQGVKNYSTKKRWIWWCGNCPAYYTHDHTDLSNKLDNWAAATNFPSAKIDRDDDDGNGWEEETEVTVISTSFPEINTVYYFYTHYKRMAIGDGTVSETPAVSAKNSISGEYDTYKYDYSESLDYYSQGADGLSNSGYDFNENTFSDNKSFEKVIDDEMYSIKIWRPGGSQKIYVSLNNEITNRKDLLAYSNWSRSHVLDRLSLSGIQKAQTVVTFKEPVSFDIIDTVFSNEDEIIEVKAEYINRNDNNPYSQIWTVQTKIEDGAFRMYLDQMIGGLSNYLQTQNQRKPEFEQRGLVAVTAWLPLQKIKALNSNDLVFLADATPTYLRMILTEKEIAMDNALTHKSDGLSALVFPKVNDLYPEWLLLP